MKACFLSQRLLMHTNSIPSKPAALSWRLMPCCVADFYSSVCKIMKGMPTACRLL